MRRHTTGRSASRSVCATGEPSPWSCRKTYTAMFSIPDPELSKKLIDASRFALGKAILSIRDGEDFPPRKAGVLDHLKSGIVNTLFYRFFVKSSPCFCIRCVPPAANVNAAAPLVLSLWQTGVRRGARSVRTAWPVSMAAPSKPSNMAEPARENDATSARNTAAAVSVQKPRRTPNKSLPPDLTRWSRLICCFFDFLFKTTFEFLSNLRYNTVTTCS